MDAFRILTKARAVCDAAARISAEKAERAAEKAARAEGGRM